MHQRARLIPELVSIRRGRPQAEAHCSGPATRKSSAKPTRTPSLAVWRTKTAASARIQSLKTRPAAWSRLFPATGNNEELRHQIDLLNQKVDQQQKDFALPALYDLRAAIGCGRRRSGPQLCRHWYAMPSRTQPAQAVCRPGAFAPVGANPAPSGGGPFALHRRRERWAPCLLRCRHGRDASAGRKPVRRGNEPGSPRRNMTKPKPRSVRMPMPIPTTRAFAPGDLLGRQYRLYPA